MTVYLFRKMFPKIIHVKEQHPRNIIYEVEIPIFHSYVLSVQKTLNSCSKCFFMGAAMTEVPVSRNKIVIYCTIGPHHRIKKRRDHRGLSPKGIYYTNCYSSYTTKKLANHELQFNFNSWGLEQLRGH